MSPKTGPLPEFDNPPVSEVAVSVEFSPLENWRSTYAGVYWSLIKERYPNTDVQPPLPSQIENLEEDFWPQPTFQVAFGNPDLSRFWFLAEPSINLIQVQRDRFVFNWRKVQGDEVYPRYLKEIRPRFALEWKGFMEFVSSQKIGKVAVLQCDLTYVNDIFQGQGWKTFQDSLSLFSPWWKGGTDGFLPIPEFLNVSGSFRMADDQGRLHFAAQPVIRQNDGRKAIQLRLTARGKPRSSNEDDILTWLNVGHEWIVRGFSDLTSKQAHELWKRTK